MMKNRIQELVERASEWPENAQEELMQSMLDIEARYLGVYITDKEERAALKRSAEDVRSGRFASDEDVKKVLHQFHRA
jgi:hypothetical protein